ncbi:MAG: hypothetical protein CVU65_17010, partial [Deltaproteobacteria bacterium HGW-Deltaproteobacteria-22]
MPLLLSFLLLMPPVAAHAATTTFPADSYIIPMDTTYQDSGMLKAFGLVYQLLLHQIRVYWIILPGKVHGQADFTASAVDVPSNAVITNHGYRGGPFVIHADDAAAALPIITAWKSTRITTVHRATAPFVGDVSKTMVVAPRLAIFADGNEDIAFGYLNAAGIPDSTGAVWTSTSPDYLTPTEVAGSLLVPNDGALFDSSGTPLFCQMMSMHYDVKAAQQALADAVVAEVRSFLGFRTHFFAECKAVNTFENNVNGRFLTPNGFLIGGSPSPVVFLNQWYPFAQLDGNFGVVGGSEPSYSLPAGDTYKDADIVMLTKNTTPLTGNTDLWMTGYLDGGCSIDPLNSGGNCSLGIGKISYLGGHSYTTKVPISTNPTTQGTRLFLNSLFEADCVLEETQPVVSVTKSSASFVTDPVVVFTLDYANMGESVAFTALLQDPLPAGTTFVSASNGGTLSGGVVRWSLGNLGVHQTGTVTLTLQLSTPGTYDNQAELQYFSGTTPMVAQSNVSHVTFQIDTDGDGCSDEQEAAMGTDPNEPDTDIDGIFDCEDTCPLIPNPLQELSSDPDNCGECGLICLLDHASEICVLGECAVSACDTNWGDCDLIAANGCETDLHTSIDHCGACGGLCAPANADPDCVSGACEVGSCLAPWADCDGLPGNGCEEDLENSLEHCGGCGAGCAPADAVGLCSAGLCLVDSCVEGMADCDGLPANGCEINLLEAESDCGGCGAVCAPASADGLCVLGVCTVDACLSGFGDCDGLVANGCEVDLQISLADCGGCGSLCAPDNALARCESGLCVMDACTPGFGDCDGLPANGCEADLATSLEHCGGCGAPCAPAGATGSCEAGTCAIGACLEGRADCNTNPDDGCEAELATSLEHCGGCGAPCAPDHATGSCVDGSCVLESCNDGFLDCDGDGTGCETDIAADQANCGGCDHSCAAHAGANAASVNCSLGVCVYQCQPGWADLNGDLQSGDQG